MAGNATVLAPSSSAIFIASLWQLASSSGAFGGPGYPGPTVGITQRAGSSPAVVATAFPVGRPWGYRVRRISLHSSRMLGPPLVCIAAATPPAPTGREV